jgi:hypothetical protein
MTRGYRKGEPYLFHFEHGRRENAVYLGKNRQGMHRFMFATGEVWTGFSPPVERHA